MKGEGVKMQRTPVTVKYAVAATMNGYSRYMKSADIDDDVIDSDFECAIGPDTILAYSCESGQVLVVASGPVGKNGESYKVGFALKSLEHLDAFLAAIKDIAAAADELRQAGATREQLNEMNVMAETQYVVNKAVKKEKK